MTHEGGGTLEELEVLETVETQLEQGGGRTLGEALELWVVRGLGAWKACLEGEV